ncbi:flagellar motor protein MotB (plasmid) [Pontibacillus sp. ALD_SL1]|uniref:flagellar motor protein MotB n=1 Tax=Pontibacillus sp. ALD_SL1 TaxID=2777185 RepID=UPI001A96F93C|nr:flagellar motor protein MotB [Pontibacillus sp. ALD_SL1]QST02878.1 flagellar motor protein MotB [Pontibacillus sp. ALD_SL1]
MGRKKRHEEHVDESWLIPYADVLTLLLALFIVLFASSNVNEGKYKEMAAALNNVLAGGDNVLQYTATVPTEGRNDWVIPDDADNADQMQEELNALKAVQERLDDFIEEKGLEFSLDTDLTKKGLMITILDEALFESGSAVVKPNARELAEDISELLVSDPPREIQVSGHTDNRPISTFQYRSNWDLSAMRAINFMRILEKNTNLSPQQFSASGYGEYHPVDTNSTKEGRQKNRRVEVLILPTISLDAAVVQ